MGPHALRGTCCPQNAASSLQHTAGPYLPMLGPDSISEWPPPLKTSESQAVCQEGGRYPHPSQPPKPGLEGYPQLCGQYLCIKFMSQMNCSLLQLGMVARKHLSMTFRCSIHICGIHCKGESRGSAPWSLRLHLPGDSWWDNEVGRAPSWIW